MSSILCDSCSACLQDVVDGVHKVAPSPVVHVRGLADDVTDSDLHEAVLQFGVVRYWSVLPILYFTACPCLSETIK